MFLLGAQVVKKEIVITDMVNGFIPIKLLTKENGLTQKNKVKESKPGLMVIYIKENLKIVNGVEKGH